MNKEDAKLILNMYQANKSGTVLVSEVGANPNYTAKNHQKAMEILYGKQAVNPAKETLYGREANAAVKSAWQNELLGKSK